MTQDYRISLDNNTVLYAVQAALSSPSSSSTSRRSSAPDSGLGITVLVDVPVRSWQGRFQLDPPPPYSLLPSSEHPPSHTSTESTTGTITTPTLPNPSSWEQLSDETANDGDENRNSDYQTCAPALGCEIDELILHCETPLESPRHSLVGLGEAGRPPQYEHPPAYTSTESLSMRITGPSSPSPSWAQALDEAESAGGGVGLLRSMASPRSSTDFSWHSAASSWSSVDSSRSSAGFLQSSASSSSWSWSTSSSIPAASSSSSTSSSPAAASQSSSASSQTLNEPDAFDWDAVGAEYHPLTSLSSSLETLHSVHAMTLTSLLELMHSQHATMLAASLEALRLYHGQESRSHNPGHAPVVRRRQRFWRRIRRVFPFLRRS